MTKPVTILSKREVENAEVVLVQNATYNDMGPINGAFEVFDIDLCSTRGDDGSLCVTVNCRLNDDDSEGATIDLNVQPRFIQGVVGFDGDVIDGIGVPPSLLQYAKSDQ